MSAGEECTTPPCTTCALCAPGHFKAAAGTEPCTACPVNTYRETQGATALSDCIDCAVKSTTRELAAQSTWRSCICDNIYYRIKFDTATDECQVCPPGLTCYGDDTYDVVVAGSNWVKDDAIIRLVDCPTGYYVENGGEHFSADIQRCEPCEKGTRYVYRYDHNIVHLKFINDNFGPYNITRT